ncbi:MAG: caspase family protein [Fibrobacterales bacterium]
MNKVLCFLVFLVLATIGESKEIRRFALAIGSNFGGEGRVPLRYATTDAVSFLSVMKQMGGVLQSDQQLIKEPTRIELLTILDSLNRQIDKVKSVGQKSELILYYSGHANDKGLLLGEELLGYKELRSKINEMRSDIKIAVLDACASGTITRFKGGLRRKAFLVDESSDMKGYAFITSSAGDEVSQESDRISGSFFTHYLVTGLRGAADISGDKKVTLSEAYQFAFNETLSNTEKTSGGAQHANYDMKLTGTGDVVFTDVREISSGLLLGENIAGRLFVRNSEGYLIAELSKQGGRSIELGLEPGEYSISLEAHNRFKKSSVVIPYRKRIVVNGRDFTTVEQEQTVSRGGAVSLTNEGAVANLTDVDTVVTHDTIMIRDTRDTIPQFLEQRATKTVYFHKRYDEPFNGTLLNFGVTETYGGISESSIAAIGNINKGYIGGIQVGGVFNIADDIEFFQGAGVVNLARKVTGFQAAGYVNIAENLEGFQMSGFINAADTVVGFQGSGFINISDSISGFQAAGFINVSEPIQGFQAAGFMNVSNAVEGFQAAGFMNVSDAVEGFQAAGFMNASDKVVGTQVAGAINIADDVSDHQVTSILNVAGDVGGVQIGLINISDSCDYPIGLINYSKNGRLNGNIWVDETGLELITLATGGKKLYTTFTAAEKITSNKNVVLIGMGYGYRHDFGGFYSETDFGWNAIFNPPEEEEEAMSWSDFNNLFRLKSGMGIKFGPYISLFTGVSLNLLITERDVDPLISPVGDLYLNSRVGTHDHYRWFGIYAGLKLGI